MPEGEALPVEGAKGRTEDQGLNTASDQRKEEVWKGKNLEKTKLQAYK
jgi:hypothetical protein